ncbi:flavin reductase family protein [Cupriavidus basilensis]
MSTRGIAALSRLPITSPSTCSATGRLPSRSGLQSRRKTRFDGVANRRLDGGGIVLEESMAWFHCRREHSLLLGDHIMFVGRVVEFHEESASPLIFWRSRFLEDRQSEAQR